MDADRAEVPIPADGKRRPFKDPVTGDPLTWGEELSWLMQGIIRRWTFLLLITVVTIIVWTTAALSRGAASPSLVWWNLGASYLALLIEGTVGIAMFSQTRRDALIIREILRLQRSADRNAHLSAHIIREDPGISDTILDEVDIPPLEPVTSEP